MPTHWEVFDIQYGCLSRNIYNTIVAMGGLGEFLDPEGYQKVTGSTFGSTLPWAMPSIYDTLVRDGKAGSLDLLCFNWKYSVYGIPRPELLAAYPITIMFFLTRRC